MTDELVIRFCDPVGKPVPVSIMYTVNQRGFPFWSEWRRVGPGELAIRHPKEVVYGIEALWEIPGFGQVMVAADHDGQPLRNGIFDFRIEALATKRRRVTNRLLAAKAQGFQPSPQLRNELDALQSRRDSDTARAIAQPRMLDLQLAAWYWAGEKLELEIAQSKLCDMSVDERRSKLFGSAFFDPGAPKDFCVRFDQLFNFATIPFYRRQVEPIEGHPDWATRDRLLDQLDARGLPRKGHPLTWWIEHGLTDWMKKLSYKSLLEVMYQQVYETVSRYKDRVKIWDVINEAHDPIVKGNDLNLGKEQVYEITALACKATRDADPEAIRIVNVNRPWCVYRSEWEHMNPMYAIEYLEELAERGIEYEVNGVQMYHAGPEHYVRDMAAQSACIDRYLALGKPVHISEVQTPSSMEAEPAKWLGGGVSQAGWWHAPWDPEIQADWAEQFYTIAASKQNLGAITWWSLSDQRSFWPNGGLLDQHNQPKPGYHRLKGFIETMQSEQGF